MDDFLFKLKRYELKHVTRQQQMFRSTFRVHCEVAFTQLLAIQRMLFQCPPELTAPDATLVGDYSASHS